MDEVLTSAAVKISRRFKKSCKTEGLLLSKSNMFHWATYCQLAFANSHPFQTLMKFHQTLVNVGCIGAEIFKILQKLESFVQKLNRGFLSDLDERDFFFDSSRVSKAETVTKTKMLHFGRTSVNFRFTDESRRSTFLQLQWFKLQ